MTVSNQISHQTSQGDGTNKVFPYDFYIESADDVVVTVYDSSDMSETVLTESEYSITGLADEDGGNVTYPLSGDAISSTQFLTIKRKVPLTQDLSLTNQSNFLPEVLESQLDDIVFMVQQLSEEVDRAILVPEGSGIDPSDYISNVAAAAASATAAAASETAAAASATEAAASASIASTKATAATTAYNNTVALLPTLVEEAVAYDALVLDVSGGFFFDKDTHQGRVIRFDATIEGDINLPQAADVGAAFSVVQVGAGKAHFVREDAGNLMNIDSYTRTAGVGAMVTLVCLSNSDGTSAEWCLAGATAP